MTVYAGLSKGDRFDYLIQKCVECGVSHIVPFTSQHCVVRLESRDYEKKQQRYARIALEASKQCQRSRVVTVGEIVPFETALQAAAQNDCGLFLYEKEQQKSLSTVLREAQGSAYAVVTGPEGGFSEKEIALLKEIGGKTISLGKRILRTETAAITATALCMLYAEMELD